MAGPRNLVVGFDGTWNEPETGADGSSCDTNVVKFLKAMRSNNGQQRQHYEQGVGSRAWEIVRGGIYGYGLEKRLLGAYRFLRNRLAESGGADSLDRIFLIGFSRGAYSARRFAGLLEHSGVPRTSRDTQLGWELYLNRDRRAADELKAEGRFFDVKVEFVGVWDTVKATNDAPYKDLVLSANVTAGYHAVAIDEQRKKFPPLLWEPDPRVDEQWFPGVHSDVGGGYAEAALSDVALLWMLEHAARHGLQFKKSYIDRHVRPDPAGAIHESLQPPIWTLLGRSKRRLPEGAVLHSSVQRRVAAVDSYRPSLPDVLGAPIGLA